MTTFSGGLKVKAAFASPSATTWEVDSDGNMTLPGTITIARKVVAASVSAASSAATTTLVPRGYIEAYVSGVRVAVPYYNTA